MRAGKLNNVISLYSIVLTKNEFLEQVQSRQLIKTIRADIKYIGGKEIVNNEQLTPAQNILITIRYDNTIDETMVIGLDDKFYNIRYIEHFDKSATKITVTRIK